MTPFAEAAREFERMQEKYAEFGAQDTEPRTEWVLLLERVAEGEDPKVPYTINGWQLFSAEVMDGKTGSGEAARALTKAAKEAVKVAEQQADRRDLKKWLRDRGYGGW